MINCAALLADTRFNIVYTNSLRDADDISHGKGTETDSHADKEMLKKIIFGELRRLRIVSSMCSQYLE